MTLTTSYIEVFEQFLSDFPLGKEPKGLYAPIRYILDLGGKRLRPALTLLVADVYGNNEKEAMYAAAAIEVFHNFSLIHDDIMDNAPLRRGVATVHEKWNTNTGILSGDAMLILAYRLLEYYEGDIFKKLMTLFNQTAIQVCEGQQYDIDFEKKAVVTLDEYITMIRYKTAVLVGAAMQMGAYIGNAPERDAAIIYEFGINLGLAFQIKDDYLDVFGTPESFGKQLGGDIIENKKTYLFLTTMELLDKKAATQLLHLYSISPSEPQQKIATVKSLMQSCNADKKALETIEAYTEKALTLLKDLEMHQEQSQILRDFADKLLNRNV